MKKSLKITVIGALALCLLAGVALSPATSAETFSAVSTQTETAVSEADVSALSTVLDVSVSKRDASGEYDPSEAKTLSRGMTLQLQKRECIFFRVFIRIR